jgi:glycosyltransferase involved in cell wall biosynthesis
MKVSCAMISSFRTQCGNAINTEYIANDLTKLVNLKIFAEKIFPPFTEILPMNDNIKIEYERCWQRRMGFKTLEEKLLEFSPDIVHIHFSPGFFNEVYKSDSDFQNFMSNLRSNNIKIILNLFDIPDKLFPGYDQSFNSQTLPKWYKKSQAKFIVMNQDMANALHIWYPEADVAIIPHGAPKYPQISTFEARQKLGLNASDFLLVAIGYYGPFKGMLGMINAIPKLNIPDFKVAFVGGFHPLSVKIHREHINECIKQSIKLGVINNVIFLNKLILTEEVGTWCAAADFMVSLSDAIGVHSASSVAPLGFFLRKPTIVGNGSRYSALIDGENCIKTSEDKIAEVVNQLYTDKDLRQKIIDGELEYAKQNSFEEIAKKHLEFYKHCLEN